MVLYGPAPVDAGPTDAGKDSGSSGKDGGPAVLYGPAPVDSGQ